MLSEMPAGLFAEWSAFMQAEPWGDKVTNMQLAELCRIVAMFGGAKDVKQSTYLPQTKEYRKPKTVDELHAKFRMFVAAHNKAEALKNG